MACRPRSTAYAARGSYRGCPTALAGLHPLDPASSPLHLPRSLRSPPLLGACDLPLCAQGEDAVHSYILTGNRLWGAASDGEKAGVVRAFGANRVVRRVECVNAM
eukprot:668313-Prymnesium_polylepis.1